MAACSAARELSISPSTSPSLGVAQTGGTLGAEGPLGLGNDTPAGIPSAPWNRPNKLSNVWFSIMISMTCLTGEPAMPADAASAGRAAAAGADVAVKVAAMGTSQAARRRFRPILLRRAGKMTVIIAPHEPLMNKSLRFTLDGRRGR